MSQLKNWTEQVEMSKVERKLCEMSVFQQVQNRLVIAAHLRVGSSASLYSISGECLLFYL